MGIVFGVASSSNGLSTRFYSVQCALGWTFFQSVQAAMFAPILVVLVPSVVLTGIYMVRRVVPALKRKRWKLYSRRIFVSVLVLIFFTLPSVTSTVLEVFACREVDGTMYLLADMTQECYTDSHVRWMIAAGAFFLVYIVGVPAFGLVVLYRKRESLSSVEGKRKFAFLTSGYLPNRYYWEMIVLETNPIAQVYAATWVIAIALFVHIKASPYAFSVLTGTEMLSLMVTFLILMAAQVYYVPELGGSDEEVVNTEYHAVLTIVLVVLLVGTTFYMASLAVRQKLSKMRDKLPRIVWCLCRLSALEA